MKSIRLYYHSLITALPAWTLPACGMTHDDTSYSVVGTSVFELVDAYVPDAIVGILLRAPSDQLPEPKKKTASLTRVAYENVLRRMVGNFGQADRVHRQDGPWL
jgi:hypothetical protein